MTQDQPALADFLAAVAAEAGAAAEPSADGSQAFRRGRRTFAYVKGNSAELLLDEEIAEAAVRTPDTTPSGRGRGWIRFSPRDLDGHAEDRARAWFLSAWRAAATPRE